MNHFEWTDATVAEALGVRASGEGTPFVSVSTDSRNVGKGDLFVALVGEHFDGHHYVASAVTAGAAGVVVSRPIDAEATEQVRAVPAFQVEDTLVAYGALAAYRRASLPARVVGITGSSGKTTTKDLTSGALSTSLRTHATTGNLNNRIGLPRTILEAPVDAEVLVLEMGTNEPGEIGALTDIANPDIGVITTVSESHLEGLGSLDGVLDEKLALLRGLSPDGVGFVGDDPESLRTRARELGHQIRVAGLSEDADTDLTATELEVQSNGAFRFKWHGQNVELQIPGEAAVVDALLALGVARQLGVSPEAAVRGVGTVEAGWLRGELRRFGTLTAVLDCYNANPQSVRAAVRTLERMPSRGPRILVLGSMLELGAESEALHESVLAEVAEARVDRIYASGLFASAPAMGRANVVTVSSLTDLEDRLVRDLSGTETLLLKASRGVKLERIVPSLASAFGSDTGAGSNATSDEGGA